ncbi:hypothetical protein [Marinobacter fuscus]|uniref:hypothetical protein n=1 Tax=Marinobacter fuscus TaxID=2109942 RepID=UPI001F0CAA2B|nr:hypothetical protein [Marinobacter fuscus]
MKKLLLAVVASAVAAGSVNAATVYEKDGFTYKLNGDFQVQLRKKLAMTPVNMWIMTIWS